MALFHSFLRLGNIPVLHIYTHIHTHYILFIHSSISGCLGCFYVLAIVNSTVMNTVGHVSFQTFFFSRYMPRIAESYGHSIFGLLGNLHILFQSGCTLNALCGLHSHQQYKRVGRTLSWLSSIPVAPSTLAFFGLWLHDPVSASSHRAFSPLCGSPPLDMRTSVIHFRACPDSVWPYHNLITSSLRHWREMGEKTHFQVSVHSPVRRLGFERIAWRRPSLTHSALFFQVFTVWPSSLLPYGRHFFFTFYFIYLGHTGSSLLCEAFCSCREWELFFVAGQGLLACVDSVVAEHRLLVYRLK